MEVCGLLPVLVDVNVVVSNTDVFLMYLWGWKVIMSYSSVILGPPHPTITHLLFIHLSVGGHRWLSYLISANNVAMNIALGCIIFLN